MEVIKMSEYEVYYKIYKSESLNGKLTILTMQDFDECDYLEKRFLKDKEGNILRFDNEKEAIQWLLDNIKEELIDPEYLKSKISACQKELKALENLN
jgi:superfamily I DNA and RNA helicase